MKYVKLYEQEDQPSKAELWYLASIGLWSINRDFLLSLTDEEIDTINELDVRVTIVGDLAFYKNRKIKRLPNSITVEGSLNLQGTAIITLPTNLIVRGFLNLAFVKIKSLPDGLQVDQDLSLYGSSIRSLPNGLKVGGNLNLTKTKISSLPDDLRVGGKIYKDN